MKNNFWMFSDEQKSMFVAQTSERVGLPPQAVEKDWWVTMTLKALFESSCRDFITFKGGTSLSKGWHVIERFSEDIDIAIDKSFWGIAGDNKSQRDRIRKLSRAYIEQRLVAEMQALLEGYGASDFELRAVPAQDSDADPTLVLLPYRSIYANIEYVESQIRIEFSCRSLKEPRERIEISPLVAEAYPEVFGKLVFPIYAVVPTRTFLEKVFLLHEEFQKENPRVERMTRHLYDLERLMDTDFGKTALAEPKMYAEIVKHRSMFNTIRGIDYRTHHPSRINFIPPEELAEMWCRDYERMQEYFIYGDSLSYDRLIARMAELRDRFRKVVMEDDFSANRNYEFRLLFPERSSPDRGERRDFCFDRFVLRHGFSGISALAGACFACPRRTWRDRILLFSVGSSADLSERFFVGLGVVSREAKRKQRQKESVPNSGVKEVRTRSCRNLPLFLPIRFRTIGFSKMHSPPSTNIPIRIWAMPLTGRIGKFCADACFIWHVWRLFRTMCHRFGFGMIG